MRRKIFANDFVVAILGNNNNHLPCQLPRDIFKHRNGRWKSVNEVPELVVFNLVTLVGRSLNARGARSRLRLRFSI